MAGRGDRFGPAPVLVVEPERSRGTVLLLHGQYADALANIKELCLLAGAGWNAVGVDAPDHGRRFHPERDARFENGGLDALDAHIEAASTEIPGVLDGAAAAGLGPPYGIVGISLGAYSLWRALPREPRLRAAVPLLGSPTLPGDPQPDPDAWAGRAVFAQNAAHDEVVELGPTRRLIDAIGGELHVIAESPHSVPELKWWGAWGRTLRWLDAHLG